MATLPQKFLLQIDDPQGALDYIYPDELFFKDIFRRLPIKLVDTDSWVSVPVSNMGRLEKIIIVPSDAFSPPPLTTIRFVINDGVNPVYNIDLPTMKLFVWNVHPSFYSKIQSLSVKTSSITETNIDILLVATQDPPAVI